MRQSGRASLPCPDAPRPADHGALAQVREARAEACAEAEAAVEARVAAALARERAQLAEQVLRSASLSANLVSTGNERSVLNRLGAQ